MPSKKKNAELQGVERERVPSLISPCIYVQLKHNRWTLVSICSV